MDPISQFYRDQHRPLVAYCRRWRIPDDPEDIAQETWRRFLRDLTIWGETYPWRRILYGEARRLLNDRYRYSRRHPCVSLDQPFGETQDEYNDGPWLMDRDELPGVEAMIDFETYWAALTDEQREALALAAIECSQDEAASVLGLTRVGYRARLFRGRAILERQGAGELA